MKAVSRSQGAARSEATTAAPCHMRESTPSERRHDVGVVADSAAPRAVYIDRHRLIRDCVGEWLTMHLPGWAIECVASIRDLQSDGSWPAGSLAILHAHELRLGAPGVADEIAAIAESAPAVPLIVMSDLEDVDEIHMALKLGAQGFLPATMPLLEAAAAIRFVSAGGTYIPQCVLAATCAIPPTPPAGPKGLDGNPVEFSPRQLQVLEGLQQGKQNKIIAYELNMCESTVKVHIRHIMKKLNARNRTQVVLLTNSMTSQSARAFAA